MASNGILIRPSNNFGQRIIPPQGKLAKWFFYKNRYGFLHAFLRYLGIQRWTFWNYFGSLASKKYLRLWIKTDRAKIVNLGGGGNLMSGVLTADIDPRADVFVDLVAPFPFDDDSIKGIFLEEAIEHIYKVDALKMLKECYRVLEPGGVLRISTPDLDWICMRLLNAGMDCDEFNANFFDHGHRYLFTRKELIKCLEIAGFCEMRSSEYKDSKSKLGLLDSHAERFNHNPLLSQYLEAYK